ncbi:hypothetical protein AVEN_268714-1 [Araneus ventricosus]|uniref:Uncharacterized protein n=1 Tax=Araneus ventricosus TaxID=182803 RepID=A0A4Y2HSG6_ARAVE|nr:hypothetical protein AVEN_268714-1 [Araneus ventricosus]
MNNIEDIWEAVLHAVEKRSQLSFTPMDLLTALQDSCCGFPTGYLQTLVESIPRRFGSLLRALGLNTILGRCTSFSDSTVHHTTVYQYKYFTAIYLFIYEF